MTMLLLLCFDYIPSLEITLEIYRLMSSSIHTKYGQKKKKENMNQIVLNSSDSSREEKLELNKWLNGPRPKSGSYSLTSKMCRSILWMHSFLLLVSLMPPLRSGCQVCRTVNQRPNALQKQLQVKQKAGRMTHPEKVLRREIKDVSPSCHYLTGYFKHRMIYSSNT